jgi:hypothetical protein
MVLCLANFLVSHIIMDPSQPRQHRAPDVADHYDAKNTNTGAKFEPAVSQRIGDSSKYTSKRNNIDDESVLEIREFPPNTPGARINAELRRQQELEAQERARREREKRNKANPLRQALHNQLKDSKSQTLNAENAQSFKSGSYYGPNFLGRN